MTKKIDVQQNDDYTMIDFCSKPCKPEHNISYQCIAKLQLQSDDEAKYNHTLSDIEQFSYIFDIVCAFVLNCWQHTNTYTKHHPNYIDGLYFYCTWTYESNGLPVHRHLSRKNTQAIQSWIPMPNSMTN